MAAQTESDSDESYSPLRSVTHGASVYLVGTGFNHALGFLFNLLMSRVLGAKLYGIYTFGYTLAQIASTFAILGTDRSILKFIPQYEDDPSKQNRIMGLVYVTSLVGSVITGLVLYVFAPLVTNLTLGNPLLTGVLRVFAFFIPLQALTMVVVSVFQSLELPGYQMTIKNGVMPVLRLLAAGVALAIGATLVGVTAAVVAASALTLLVGFALVLSRTSLRPARGNSREDAAEFYTFSVPLTFQKMGTVLYSQVDILMVGIFLAGSAVGIYKVSVLLAGLLTLPLAGFNQLFPPIASRLYANQEVTELKSLYQRVTRWIFTISLFPAIGAVIYSSETLLLFGPEFTSGKSVLVLFIIAQLTNAAVGPSGYVLIMTDHQYLALINEWILGGLNVVLNY
ncbi:MAG TPA: flippase, partial [Halococcus sp.]|nr:flippase [Halococcus sp.]